MNKIIKSNKKVLILFLILRLLLIQSIIIELISKNYSNSILCIITLLIFTLPILFNNKSHLDYPSIFEVLFYIFIISYELISIILPNQEIILQLLNGLICTGLLFKIVNMLNKSNIIKLSPIFISLVTICFSITLCTVWELIEYSSDKFISTDIQKSQIISQISSKVINKKDETKSLKIKGIAQTIIHHQDGTTIIENGFLDLGIIDTMQDLFIDLLVAIIFNIFGFIYLKRQEN